MLHRRGWFICGLVLAAGCSYQVREQTDSTVHYLSSLPFDVSSPASPPASPAPAPAASGNSASAPPPAPAGLSKVIVGSSTDVKTTALMTGDAPPLPSWYIQTNSTKPTQLTVPPELPGSEAGLIVIPKDDAQRKTGIQRLYPELPALEKEPDAVAGPGGKPFTLASLQQLAASNSPAFRQAASDVETARGNLMQAGTYQNPTVAAQIQPSNDGSTAGVQGFSIDQKISTGGKMRLQVAAAQKDFENAQLALVKARSDLSTQIRNAYFALLVAKEQVRVNRALARFTDDIYRLQADLAANGFAAPYEPAALRAQAFTARLALKQSISNYVYSWKQLVTVVGLRDMPLTEVSGRIDAAIPFFDYDAVRTRVLSQHTDLMMARNGIEKARYQLRLAQVTPAVPDVDVQFAVLKEFALPPFQTVATAQIGIPLTLWDHNKGNIIAAQGTFIRASEEPRRVETVLTNNLATQYTAYKTSLDSLEYYRKFILPDQVRAFRGVYERRRTDPNVAFSDLVGAQTTLSGSITTYLSILSQLWTSVVGVADLLQTEDMFQYAEARALPALPEFAPSGQLNFSQYYPREKSEKTESALPVRPTNRANRPLLQPLPPMPNAPAPDLAASAVGHGWLPPSNNESPSNPSKGPIITVGYAGASGTPMNPMPRP